VRVDVEGAAGMHGHRRAIEQIVDNLVANARRYANDRVTVQIATRGVQTVISVCDDGPGFPEQFLVSAFDRFSQADPSRRRASGAGLGLAIVSALIERQGGTVTARNGPPLGGGVVEVTLATGH
jgi:two-component system OmpR family sensor kinase